MEPLVSVIIPTYNRAIMLVEAVRSVLGQTYKRIETIVVDDGSTDNTQLVLRKYHSKIKYLWQVRGERSKARNEGFRHSKGDYVAFLDSDDLWLPTKIDRQVQVLETQPDVGLVYTDVQFVDIDGAPYAGQISWDEPVRDKLYEDLMTHNVVTGSLSSIMLRRECVEKVGLFDESMTACEDLDLYRRLEQHYGFHKIDSPLVRVRIHKDNTQRHAAGMAKGWEITIEKISRDTPAQFAHYKYEAIVKNLSQIAALYHRAGESHRFLYFCARSLFQRPNWIFQWGFWRELSRLSLRRYLN